MDTRQPKGHDVAHQLFDSLQFVISLLALQGDNCTDTSVRAALRKSSERIMVFGCLKHYAMASNEGGLNQFGFWLELALEDIIERAAKAGIEVRMEIDCTEVIPRVAVPLGLCIYELFSNAIEHAFPGNRKGKVAIRVLATCDTILTEVADDGIGIQNGECGPRGRCGSAIIKTLVGQMGGTLTYWHDSGMHHAIAVKCGETALASSQPILFESDTNGRC